MWIVRLALRRPYTFVCVALLMVIFGALSIYRTPIDIFPTINLPVVSAIWSYGGLSPKEMEERVVTVAERTYSGNVNNIEHIESESLNGVAIIKVYFQPDANLQTGVAQITASSQGVVRTMPPGITPPAILQFNATDVVILELGVGSRTLTEAQLTDYGSNFIRTPLATIHGVTVPPSYGGVPRLINVDLDPALLFAKGISPADVTTAINQQNVILPSGTAKMGTREYFVRLNSSPDSLLLLGDLPIKQVNGATIYLKDVAQVRDGAGVQTNVVRVNGRRGTYLTFLKNGAASTLAVVNQVKAMLPQIRASLPPAVDLQLLADQSVYVQASILGVVREAAIAAGLTALMILVFLGSWRSTLIVVTTIPLAILTSIVCLGLLGQTLNTMTLSGLALAVGILVDDATVEIENTTRNMAPGKPLVEAILESASQVATPTFVSTSAICIVFLPLFALSGAAAALFRSLALAVIFALLASYFLSRTLIPTMMRALLAHQDDPKPAGYRQGWFARFTGAFERGFSRFRVGYLALLNWAMGRRTLTVAVAGLFVAGSLVLVPTIGEDFFPTVDAGQFSLHVRAPAGTRIESTELLFAQVEQAIRRVVPSSEITLMLDNIGLATSGVNLATGSSSSVGPADGDLYVQLKTTGNTDAYKNRLRAALPAAFPGVTFFFQPADIVNQVLNLGLPAPIDVQVAGQSTAQNYQLARRIAAGVTRVKGAADVRVQQVVDAPQFLFSVDRVKADQLGITQRDVASDLLISLSSSAQTAPNFWLNPQNGVQYAMSAMTPQYKMTSLAALDATPVTTPAYERPELLGNLATASRQTTPAVVNHYNVQPVYDVYAAAAGRDLGGVARDVDAVIASVHKGLPRGTTITVRGQVASMNASFVGLGVGIVFAIALVYLLLVVNFQSWLDPLVIVMALPGALAGILWMLFVTRTTFNVPSLMGAIMAVGVATANSVLVITFADDQRRAGRSAAEAAVDAGYTRLRPVCMTALAMGLGMLPMALGYGDGGEQNAPLGRAVIGGLAVATLFTLFVVPVLYSVLRAGPVAPELVLPDVPARAPSAAPAPVPTPTRVPAGAAT